MEQKPGKLNKILSDPNQRAETGKPIQILTLQRSVEFSSVQELKLTQN